MARIDVAAIYFIRMQPNVAPRPQPRIDRCMVNGIEARICSIDRMKERQKMNATENARERTAQKFPKSAQIAAREAVDIGL